VVGIAAAWRFRDRAVIAGVVVAVVVSLKPDLWPLGLWLLTSRRYRALAWAMLSALALSVGAFAALGLGEVGQYVAQLHRFLADAERRSYSIFSLALHLGPNHALAYAVLAAATAVAVSACVVAGRKGHETAAISAQSGQAWWPHLSSKRTTWRSCWSRWRSRVLESPRSGCFRSCSGSRLPTGPPTGSG
jgi:hypothetical protein